MLRALVLVLALANLAYFGWAQGWLEGLTGVRPDSQREPERLARQVRPETVQILSPTAAATAPPADAAPPALPADVAASAVAGICIEAGPFSAAEVDAAASAVQAVLPAGSWADVKTDKPGSWIVYMGRFFDREAVAKKKDELARIKIPFEELRNSPGLEPGLSLGRFDERAAADRAIAQLALRGVRSARIVEISPVTSTHVLRVDPADPDQTRLLAELKSAALGKGFGPCVKVAAN